MSVYLSAVLAVALIVSALMGLIAVKKAFFNIRIFLSLLALTCGTVAISLLFPAILGRLSTAGGFTGGWALAVSALLCILLAYLASIILEYILSGRITEVFERMKDFTFGAALKPSLITQQGRSACIITDLQEDKTAPDPEILQPADMGAVVEKAQTEDLAANNAGSTEETEEGGNAESAGMPDFVCDTGSKAQDESGGEIDIEGIIAAFVQRDTGAAYGGNGEEAAAVEVEAPGAEDIEIPEEIPGKPEGEADTAYTATEADSGQAEEGIPSDKDEAEGPAAGDDAVGEEVTAEPVYVDYDGTGAEEAEILVSEDPADEDIASGEDYAEGSTCETHKAEVADEEQIVGDVYELSDELYSVEEKSEGETAEEPEGAAADTPDEYIAGEIQLAEDVTAGLDENTGEAEILERLEAVEEKPGESGVEAVESYDDNAVTEAFVPSETEAPATEDIEIPEEIPDEPEEEADTAYTATEADSGQAEDGILLDRDEEAELAAGDDATDEEVTAEPAYVNDGYTVSEEAETLVGEDPAGVDISSGGEYVEGSTVETYEAETTGGEQAAGDVYELSDELYGVEEKSREETAEEPEVVDAGTLYEYTDNEVQLTEDVTTAPEENEGEREIFEEPELEEIEEKPEESGFEALEACDDNAVVEVAGPSKPEEAAAEDDAAEEKVMAETAYADDGRTALGEAEAVYTEPEYGPGSCRDSEYTSSGANESVEEIQIDEEIPAHLVEELEGDILEKSVDSEQNIDTMGIETLNVGIAVEKTATEFFEDEHGFVESYEDEGSADIIVAETAGSAMETAGSNKAAGNEAFTASLGSTDNLIPKGLTGEQYADVAFRLKEKGNIEGAVHNYMRALDMKPDSSLVFWIVLDMCAIYRSIGQNELAREILASYADTYSGVMDEGIRKEIERNLI